MHFDKKKKIDEHNQAVGSSTIPKISGQCNNSPVYIIHQYTCL